MKIVHLEKFCAMWYTLYDTHVHVHVPCPVLVSYYCLGGCSLHAEGHYESSGLPSSSHPSESSVH